MNPAPQQNAVSKQNNKRRGFSALRASNPRSVALIVINLAILICFLFLVYRNINQPVGGSVVDENSALIQKIANIANLSGSQKPSVLTISNVDKLRESDAIQAQVYRDAQNGDYVLGYGDTMIIYRDGEGKIIYQGDTPNKILSDTQTQLTDKIIRLSLSAKILRVDDSEIPQISAITDELLKANSNEFYSKAQKGDIVAIFPSNKVIVLYRSSTEKLAAKGSYETVIKAL